MNYSTFFMMDGSSRKLGADHLQNLHRPSFEGAQPARTHLPFNLRTLKRCEPVQPQKNVVPRFA